MNNYLRWICTILSVFILTISILHAGEGYRIEVKLDGFSENELYLGYYYGDKQYIKDTVTADENGLFVFSGEKALEGGIYLVVLPPDNKFFQLLISEGEQQFKVHTQAEDPASNMQIEGSADNALFYKYMAFLQDKRPKAANLNEEMEKAGEDEKKQEKLKSELKKLDEEVKDFQEKILREQPHTLTAVIIRTNQQITPPKFKGENKEIQNLHWQYFRTHWFDHFNFSDPRLLRTPVLFQRVDHYMNKLTVQHPDSLARSVDRVLELASQNEETFKYYLIHFLNFYAQSKIVGMDAVYVHIAEKYYATGQAPWTEEEQLEKILKNARTLKPILIGKTAPDILMQKKDKTPLALHEVRAPFTVLFFWDPDCGHCKKSMPEVIDFYDKFKDKGVEIFAVCTKITDDVPQCWETIEEKDMGRWINVVDPYLKSKYKTIYDIRTTPRIFVLDENKKILSKSIGAEQLEEVLEQLIKIKEEEKSHP